MLIAFLFLLPTLSFGTINVNVAIDTHLKRTEVKAEGFNYNIITAKEIDTFALDKDTLKASAEKCLNGYKPSHIYLKDPTEYGYTYTINNWTEVHKVLKVEKCYISRICNKTVQLTTYDFKNRLNATRTFNVTVTVNVMSNVTTKWCKRGEIFPGANITYVIDIKNQTKLSFRAPWGMNGNYKSRHVTLTKETELSFTPKQIAKFYLSGAKVTMEIKLDYKAELTGDVICFIGRHPNRCYISNVLSQAGLPNAINSCETLTIEYFSYLNLIAKDKSSGRMINLDYSHY